MDDYGTTPQGRKSKEVRGTGFVKGGESSGETVAAAETTEKLTDFSKVKPKADTGMPQPDKAKGEDMMTPSYRERLRKYREGQNAEPPKAEAVRNARKKGI